MKIRRLAHLALAACSISCTTVYAVTPPGGFAPTLPSAPLPSAPGPVEAAAPLEPNAPHVEPPLAARGSASATRASPATATGPPTCWWR